MSVIINSDETYFILPGAMMPERNFARLRGRKPMMWHRADAPPFGHH
jgi:hypothetical protein